MKILAIETSCDETALAVLEASGDFRNLKVKVLGDAVLSQASKHSEYGGVYPMLAKREHAKNIVPLLKDLLKETGMISEKNGGEPKNKKEIQKILEREPELLERFLGFVPSVEKPDIDIIAVTQGPGLEPALWVGLNFARALSLVWNIPLVPVNHMEGHVLSFLANKDAVHASSVDFPLLALLVSGGHTQLVLAKNWLSYEIIGETRDDAAGEAFDKVARMLGLPYPGGPEISRLAASHREKFPKSGMNFTLPRPMLDTADLDFSFSGLKTAVLYRLREYDDITDEIKEEMAREFEDAVIEVLVEKTRRALNRTSAKTLMLGGGVAANKLLRKKMSELAEEFSSTKFIMPDMPLSTDNAVMIGVAGYLQYQKNKSGYSVASSDDTLRAEGTISL